MLDEIPAPFWDGEPVLFPLSRLSHLGTDGTQADRLESIRQAHRDGVTLPPVPLVFCAHSGLIGKHWEREFGAIGPLVFRHMDGNHRLTIARELGMTAIYARLVPDIFETDARFSHLRETLLQRHLLEDTDRGDRV